MNNLQYYKFWIFLTRENARGDRPLIYTGVKPCVNLKGGISYIP